MTREDLFLAIGEVEESRLARMELLVQEPSQDQKETSDMRKRKVSVTRILRNLLVAIMILSMLGITAYAVGAYVIFDSPEEMIAGIFGDKTGFDHKGVTTWTDPEKPGDVYENPAYDRVPVDETVMAEDIVPHVSPIGKTLTRDGYTLTVDAYMYDSVTRSGIVTYTLEAEGGLPRYDTQSNGELWFPEGPDPVDFNQYGKTFLIQEKTTKDKLAVTYYFHYDPAFDQEFTVALGEYTDMTDAQRNALSIQCSAEIREKYTPEQAVSQAKKNLGNALFESNCMNYQNAESAYEAAAEGRYMEKLAAQDGASHITEEEANALYQQCLTEVKGQYSAEEATQKAREFYAYSYLANELYWEKADIREKIPFDCSESSVLNHVTMGDGHVTVTPISMMIQVEGMEFLYREVDGEPYIDADNVDTVVIRYRDGGEYVVRREDVSNVVYALGSIPEDSATGSHSQLSFMFNRIIDVDQIASVVINGTELKLD